MLSVPSIASGMYVSPRIVPSGVSIGSVVPVVRNCGGNCTEVRCRLLRRPHGEVAAAAVGVAIACLEDDAPVDEAAAISAVHLHVARFLVDPPQQTESCWKVQGYDDCRAGERAPYTRRDAAQVRSPAWASSTGRGGGGGWARGDGRAPAPRARARARGRDGARRARRGAGDARRGTCS